MNILFVNPSLRRGSKTKYLPVGIGSVMTYFKTHGYEFDLLDIDVDDLSDSYIEEFISSNKYDYVLTGCIVTHYKWVKWFVKTVKKYLPRAVVIVGNSVGGSAPEVFLRNVPADYVVIGEGEITALHLVETLISKGNPKEVEGIAFLENGVLVRTPKRKACNINELPLIDWNLFDVQKYFAKSDHAAAEGLRFDPGSPPRVMPVATARGCAFKCTFCHYVFWDDPYRFKSPKRVLEEIKQNMELYGANYFNFWDDLSFAGLVQAEKMVDAILSSGLRFNWNAAVRVDLFGNPAHDYERRLSLAKKFRESGCLNVGFSLESGNQEILEMMNKKIKVDFFKEQVEILKKVGITCSTSVVFGYPTETKESIRQTFDQCLSVGLYPSIGYLLPLPYTGMYDYAKKHGFIKNEDEYLMSMTERQDLCLNMTKLSNEEILSAIKAGAVELNEKLALGLDESKLIRTGGYRNHTKKTANSRPAVDPSNLKVNENDFNFNYSQAVFDIDLGTGTQAKVKTELNQKNG